MAEEKQVKIIAGLIILSVCFICLYINPSITGFATVGEDSEVEIFAENNLPVISEVIANSTTGLNNTAENITAYASATDSDGDSIKLIYNWIVDNRPILDLNLPFEGGSNATYAKDYASFAKHATVFNATWGNTSGYDRKGAYEFDGNDYMNISDPFNNSENFTISLWVKANIINNGAYHGFIGKQSTPCRKPGLWLGISNGIIHYDSYDSTCAVRYGDVFNNFFTAAGVWHHVVWVKNGEAYYFYRNGQYFGTASAPASFYKNTSIDYDIGRVDNYWNGTIDDVQIYSRPLSASQILELYNNHTDRIVSDELRWRQVWKAEVIPNDGKADGSSVASNTIKIKYAVNPDISFVSPTPGNNSYQSQNSAYINVSSNATAQSIVFDWNRTLVGWWSFENVLADGTVYDNSSYGNSAQMINFTSNTTIEGKRGEAVELTRTLSSTILITNLNVNTTAGAQNTVEFWMYWAGGNSEMPFGWDASYDLWAISSVTPCFGFNTGQGNVLGINSSNLSNKWVHVAAVFYNGVPDNINNELYINGVKQNISDCTGTTSASKTVTSSAFISGWGSTGGYKFTGNIDEMRIYNRRLSGEEINASYDANLYSYQNNFTTLAEGATYTYRAYVIDSYGNTNQTEERTLTIDSTYPLIDYAPGTPENNIYISKASIFVNVSVTETNEANITFTLYSSSAFVNQTIFTDSTRTINFTGLADDTYTFNVTVTDRANQKNATLTRTVGIDTTNPLIAYGSQTPANATTQSATNFEMNVSITEANLNEMIYNWNSTNFTAYDDPLILMMNFNNQSNLGENSTHVADASKYGNNGTVNGSAIWVSTGRYDGAYQFDGIEDKIIIKNDSSLDIMNYLTMSAWINPSSVPASDRYIIVEKLVVYYLTYDSNKKLAVYWYNTSSPGYHVSDTVINTSEWTHVLSTWNGSDVKLYINGVLDKTIPTNTPGKVDSSKVLHIGAESTNRYFNGSIDEVRIWNRSLSADEVYQQYASNFRKYEADKWEFYSNQPGLADGIYIYQAFVTDKAGNANQTEGRTVTVDSTYPLISFSDPTPENSTLVSDNSFEVNISMTELNAGSFIWNWNGINYTFYKDSLALMMSFDNLPSIGENSAYAADVSGNGNNGDVLNAVWTENGRYHGAFVFNGVNSSINTTDDALDISPGENSTFMTWIKTGVMANYPRVFSKRGSSNGSKGYECFIDKYAGSLNCNIDTGPSNPGIPSTKNVTDNQWHHVAVTIAGTTGNIYIDGELNGTNTNDAIDDGYNNYVTFKIGAPYGIGVYFDGTIDETSVWNKSLSADEIQQHYYSNLRKYDANKWEFYSNLSDLADSDYTYQAFVTDKAGNANQTLQRTITIDASAPVISLVLPSNNTGDNDGNITFIYNVSDYSTVNCSLVINNVINQTLLNAEKNTANNFNLTLSSGSYNWSINCTDSNNIMGAGVTRKLAVIKTTYFAGNTSNLSEIDISNISNFTIENAGYGKISFLNGVDLSSGADINTHINISFNRIELNSTAVSALNKSALLYLYNLTFNNPQILRDNTACSSDICAIINYSQATGIMEFNVTGFSAYSAEDYCGNSNCESGESCSSCSSDCGACPAPPSGGGGGGGSSSFASIKECTTNADCKDGALCWNNKCTKLFDIKILTLDSAVQPGEELDFTYLMKGMADISGDVVVDFWLEKDGKRIAAGSDTIFMGVYEEKVEKAALPLPKNLPIGSYQFYVQVSYENYKASSFRPVQVEHETELILEIALFPLHLVTSDDWFNFTAIWAYNKDAPRTLYLEEKILKDGTMVWEAWKDIVIDRTRTITEYPGKLKAGSYELELTGYYNNKTTMLKQSFTVEKPVQKHTLLVYTGMIIGGIIIIGLLIFLFLYSIMRLKQWEERRARRYYKPRKRAEYEIRKKEKPEESIEDAIERSMEARKGEGEINF